MKKRGLENVVENERGCLEYQGYRMANGYAVINSAPYIRPRKPILGHRLAWIAKHGEIPDGLLVLHRCDNKACINVDHLFLGTAKDNTRDMMVKGRQNFIGWKFAHKGEQCYNAKLDEKKVKLMRLLTKFTQQEMAEMFGVSFQTVSKVRRRETWKHVP